ncbi:MFS transporter [Saccharopolyspora sp. 5N102]|uniref:MFS transporter n=1 Tax=Saccharopolyspora sp. 5N102 TaxID=3375155 RepID=UPI00379748B7
MGTGEQNATEAASLLRNRRYWSWSLAVLCCRLPATMAPLAFTLLTTATVGSYRLGALMMATYVLGELAGAVPAGRLLDAIGPGRGLRLLLPVSAFALAGTWLATRSGAPAEVLLGLVVFCGITSGGLVGGFRGLLADTVPDAQLTRATSIDAMAMDAVIIAGPLLVAGLAAGGPTVPLFAMAAAFLVSVVLVRGNPPTAQVADRGPDRSRYWGRAAGWLACLFAIGHLLSTLEVATLPLAARIGTGAGTAALLLSVLSGASIVGGALFTWRGRATGHVAIACLVCFITGGALISVDLGWPGLLGGLVLVGICTGPLLSVASVQLQRILPKQRRSAGFSVAYVVQSLGFGLGALTLAQLPLTAAILLGAFSAFLALCALVGVLRNDRAPTP